MLDFSAIKKIMIPEGEVKRIMCGASVLWEKATTLPDEYQEVTWVKADKDVRAYIDLGFAFDTGAIVFLEQWLDSSFVIDSKERSTYIFGAAESSGKYRCMFTSPKNQYGAFIYGTSGFDYVYAHGEYLYEGKNSLKLVFKQGNLHWENIDTGESTTITATNVVHTMTENLYLLGQNYNGVARFNSENGYARKIGRFSYYDKNEKLICDLYPCYRKSDDEIGMYDTVRDIFLTNAGTGALEKGEDK